MKSTNKLLTMEPFISIIIPAKNEEAYLDIVLRSVFNSIDVFDGACEVIVVDNGSTDSTKDIAIKYGCKVLEVNIGSISKLRNTGAKISKGNIIVFLDADCIVDIKWISVCAKKLSNNKIGLVGTRAIPDLANATWVEEGWYKLISGVTRPDYPKWIGSSNMFIRRDVFFELGGFEENLETAEDVNFCNKIRHKYLINLEKSICTLHLRESKTLLDLMSREIRRGKCSIRQFCQSEYKIDEAFSVFIPLSYLILIATTILLININKAVSIISATIIFIIPLIMMIKKKAIVKNIRDFVKVYCVAMNYLISRSIAAIFEIYIICFNQR